MKQILAICTVLLLTACHQGEEMTGLPFVEIDQAATTTDADNPYGAYDWRSHDFSAEGIAEYDGSLYDVSISERGKFYRFSEMKIEEGMVLIYDTGEYTATGTMDRSVDNKEIVRSDTLEIQNAIDLPWNITYRYDLLTDVNHTQSTSNGPLSSSVYASTTLASDGADGFEVYKTKTTTLTGEDTILTYLERQERLHFHDPATNSEGIEYFNVTLYVITYDSAGTETANFSIDYTDATLHYDYGFLTADYPDTPQVINEQSAYLYIDGALYHLINANTSDAVAMPVPGSLGAVTGVAPKWERSTALLSYQSVLTRYMTFDDKSYTRIERDGSVCMSGILPISGGYRSVTVAGIVGDRVEITIGTAAAQVFTVAFTESGETVIAYTEDLLSTTDTCKIEVFRDDGTKAGIGTIGLSEEIKDLGVTDYEVRYKLNDTSPYKVLKGGVVDYVPGIAIYDVSVTVLGSIASLKQYLNIIKDAKRERIGWDLGDSWNATDELTESLWFIGRVDTSTLETKKEGQDVSQVTHASFTIREAS